MLTMTCVQRTLSCMGFDGPRVDAWNLFTVTVQVGQKLSATRTAKHSCQKAFYSKKKAGNVECYQSLGKMFVLCSE